MKVKCAMNSRTGTLAAALATLLASQTSQAGTITYDGNGTSQLLLNAAANWVGNVLPGSGDEAMLDNSSFTLPAGLTTTSATALTFGDLIFNSSTVTSFSQTGSVGALLTLTGGGGSSAAIAAGGATGDLLLWSNSITGSFNLGGGSGSGKLAITLSTSGNFDVVNSGASVNFIGYVINGSGGINKTGAGTLILTPGNTTTTYTGDTKVSAGTLQLGNNLILQSSVLDTSGGGSLTFSSGITTPTFGGLKSSSNLTLASTITALTLNPGTGVTANFTGALSGGATGLALTKSGAGTQILGASQSYTGTTTVSAGVLELDHATSLPGGIGATGGTSALTFAGGVLGLGAGNFTRSLAVAGTAAGVNFTQAGGWAAYGADRVVNLGGLSATITVATANTGLNSKTLILGASTATHMVDFQNPLNFGTSARTVQADDGAAAIDGKLSGNLTGTSSGGLTKTGAGTLLLSGTNTYTGLTTVSNGTLLSTNAAAQAGYTTAAKVVFNGGTIGVQVGGSGWTTTQVDTLLTNATKTSGALGLDTTNGGFTQWAAFTTSNLGSALGLTKIGSNTLTLDQTNTYAGTTTISAGTLQVGAGSGTGALATSSAIVNNGKLTFNRNNAVTQGTDFSAAPITGSGSLTQAGTSTLSLSAVNGYTGATAVNSGTLKIDTTGTINSSSGVTVAQGAKFIYNSSTAMTVATTLNGDTTAHRAVLGGSGTIGTTITLDNVGDTLAPGNSPGILSFSTNQAWSSFSYDWEVNDFASGTVPGVGGAFDQIALTGGLTLNALASVGDYQLNVLSLTGGNVTGDAQNFSEINRSWTILTTTTGIANFDATKWVIDKTGFSNAETGTWSIAQSGGNLVLSYVTVPEPDTAALLGGCGMLALLRRRR